MNDLYYSGMRRAKGPRVRRAHAVLGRFEDETHCVVVRFGQMALCLTPDQAASIADSLIDVAERVAALDGESTTTDDLAPAGSITTNNN